MYPVYYEMIKDPRYSWQISKCKHCGKLVKNSGDYVDKNGEIVDFVYYLNCVNCGKSIVEV